MGRLRPSSPVRLAATLIFGLALFSVLWCARFVDRSRWASLPGIFRKAGPPRMPDYEPLRPLASRIPCYGPRKELLSRSSDDHVQSEELAIPYPSTFSGSYDDLGLSRTWSTAAERYGPYGYGEDDANYTYSKVDWGAINWGALQNQCFDRNSYRFPDAAATTRIDSSQHLDYPNGTSLPKVHSWRSFTPTRRTAIIIRTYDGVTYTPRLIAHLRSLIVETSLLTGGEYAVILLVHIRGSPIPILTSPAAYTSALALANLPRELHDIALLWDDAMLETWYPLVPEHRIMWQVYQPLQLLAHFHPYFDHYWQLELDARFTSDAGALLDALARFSTAEPRKQALERASWLYLPSEMGPSYRDFQDAINTAARGSSLVWGPMPVPDIQPIGRLPPTASPEYDNFTWGAGEEADALLTSMCADARASTTWTFGGWVRGFTMALSTPRWFCPPAIQRSSRALLHEMHRAQHVSGLAVPSEATPISFALWHGLKISFPPLPTFARAQTWNETMWATWSDAEGGGPGGMGSRARKGFGGGVEGGVDPQDKLGEGMTWWWASLFAGEVMEAWYTGKARGAEGEELPFMLARHEGRVYAPGMALHPVKEV